MLALLKGPNNIAVLMSISGKRLEGEDDAAYVERMIVHTKDRNPETPEITEAVFIRLIGTEEVPQGHRRVRRAWRVNGKNITLHLPTAKELLIASVRADRDALLSDSDRYKMQIDEVGTKDQKDKLAKYRQDLRDLPAVLQKQLDAITDQTVLEKWQPSFPEKP